MLNFILLAVTAAVPADTAHKVAAAVTGVTAPPAPLKTEDTLNLLDFVVKGGYIMYPLAILCFLAIYFITERIIALGKASRSDGMFMQHIRESIHNGNLESAKTLCKSNSGPVARMVEKGISRIGQSYEEIEGAMETVGKLEVSRLEKNMGYLSLIAKLAPMFGFVGTILGVIKIFYDISLANNVEISTISHGLYVKMTSSAGGLTVGIIAFLGYYLLTMRIDKLVMRMEKGTMEFMDILNEPGK
ncbi:MAG: MotA/TolQ/ExbB proton channel family protein [Bacteroidia bacterium]